MNRGSNYFPSKVTVWGVVAAGLVATACGLVTVAGWIMGRALWHAQPWQVTVLASALLLCAAASMGLVWRQQRVRFYKERGVAAEAALQMEKLNLNAIFESSPVAMLILDDATNIVHFNTAALALTGSDASDVLHHRPGNALNCVHCAVDSRGCGYSKRCPLCPLRNGVESLIANGGSMHGAELMMELMRNGEPQKVWLRVGAETVLLHGRRHVCVAMEDITERTQTMETLGESERRLATLMANLPGMAYRCENLPDWPMIFVSEGCSDLTGWSPTDLMQNRPAYGELIVPADREQVWDAVQASHETREPFELTYQIQTADGRIKWVWERGRGVFGKDGALLFLEGLIADITERKMASEALRESDEMLREANKIARLGNWELNLTNSQLKWSEGIFEIFEIDANQFEATYEAFINAVHPDDREQVHRAYTESLENKTPYEITHRLLMPNGRIKWVVEICRTDYDDQGIPFRSFGIVQDITERKRAAVELAEAQALLQAALDCSTAGIAIAEAPSGQLRYVNQAGLMIRGSSEAEVVAGVDVNQYVASWKLLDLDGTPLAVEEVPLARAVLFGEKSTREFIIRRSASEDRVVLANAAPILNPAGQIIAGIVVFLDITERRQAEELVKTSLLEKESLLKEIHHRVKNNLQIISSLLRLQSGKINNPVAQAALLDTQNRVRSMALVHESLYGSEKFASVDFAAYLKQLCHQLSRVLVATPGRIQLHLDLAPVHLNIDQAIPCGLLVNELVSNAFKHAFPQDRSGELRVELQAPTNGRGCCLRVADNGVGFPPDFDLKHLTSLGLKLVTDLVRQIGGQLEIGPGPGAAFEIEFKVG